jgi:phage terminase large subunit GpA-like protein
MTELDPLPAPILDQLLPPFTDPEEIFKRASLLLMPREQMTVAQAAERYRMIEAGGYAGMWRNATAPYVVEPMNLTTSRDHEAVIFAGPARSLKTDALVLNTLLHRIVCDPCSTLIINTSQGSARLFSLEKVNLMNRLCAEARRKLSSNRNDDNVYDKLYAGMRLVLGWPTLDHLTGKDYQLVAVTEYDRMPENLGGEGSLFEQARKRNATYGSRGMTVVECSPGRDVLIDPENPWKPKGHEAPPCTGILSLYNQGDRRLWLWPCPDCGEFFEGGFERLDWPKDQKTGEPLGSIEEASLAVVMICAHCGVEISPDKKAWMNAHGHWVREGETIDTSGRIEGEGRRSSIASFWLKGPAAVFQTWQSLVRNFLRASAAFGRTGDDAELRGITNLDLGEPFVPRAAPGTQTLDPAQIKARVEKTWQLGTVQDGVRALIITVDVQGRYFDIQVTGLGVEFECWVVDRFQIAQSAEEGRLLDPGSYAEDWNLLWPLLERGWPLASDPSREMTALCMVVDSGGAAGVTGNSYRFAVAARKKGISDNRLMLLKGDSKVGARRIALTKVDWQVDGKVLAAGLRLLLVSSNNMKDDVAGALRRETPGPDFVHVPGDINDEWFTQVTAEERNPKGEWSRPTGRRNEAFDHMCYARAAVLRPPWRWDRVNWKSPLGWAQPLENNSLVRKIEDRPAPTDPTAPSPSRRLRGGFAKFGKLNAR